MSNEDDNKNRPRDMILAPNEYALISDETKGEISTYVGPNKTSLAGSDSPVIYDPQSNRYRKVTLAESIRPFVTAAEGDYIIQENPTETGRHPNPSGKQSTLDLKVGKKINIPGPASFALFPGQVAKVVEGHNLRSNEFLVVRVYDEKAARENLDKAVVKVQSTESNNKDDNKDNTGPGIGTSTVTKPETRTPSARPNTEQAAGLITLNDLSMGKLFVIKGTDVSFYIPPTGIEVVPEKINGEERFVREAVSLELLEYCLLLDQNGTKRYVHGPAVVFPGPTEKFVEAAIKSNPDKVKAKKFRAQELTPASGIHIRVIKDYEDGDKKYTAGQELFITGTEQTIYYPREEHAIIKYGEQDIHYGIAIPAGEARYVLNRTNGVISLVKGPQIFLPDPRNQVIAQRALPLNLCQLLYPNNQEAYEINAARLGITDQDFVGMASAGNLQYNTAAMPGTTSNLMASLDEGSYAAVGAAATQDTSRRIMIRGASKSLPGDAFDRKNKFTPPRSVVLNTKYDGAVAVDVWTGFAMMLVSKRGGRRVIKGPCTAMLEYDEVPQVMTLSRGKPKSTETLLSTPYLLTTANKVSDLVEVETKDFVKLTLKLSYRVNFEGEPEQWFNVDNYVKFLCDHMRSRLRSAVQKYGIEDFHGNHNVILRDIVLGPATGDGKPRAGTSFAENGMRIYDVEVLGITFANTEVEKMLMQAQRSVIQNTLNLAELRRQLTYTEEAEGINQKKAELTAATQHAAIALRAKSSSLQAQFNLQELNITAEADAKRLEMAIANEEGQASINAITLANEAKAEAQKQSFAEKAQSLELNKLRAQVQAVIDKAGAISPQLIAALQTFGEQSMVEKLSQSFAPMSLLGGGTVVDIWKKVMEGTSLAGVVDVVSKQIRGNGTDPGAKQLRG